MLVHGDDDGKVVLDDDVDDAAEREVGDYGVGVRKFLAGVEGEGFAETAEDLPG